MYRIISEPETQGSATISCPTVIPFQAVSAMLFNTIPSAQGSPVASPVSTIDTGTK